MSEVIVLGSHRLCWKELVECMPWVVDNFIKQFIISVFEQLIEFCKIRWAETTSFTSSQKRISTLTVCRSNESTPCQWCVCQPRHDDCTEDGQLQLGIGWTLITTISFHISWMSICSVVCFESSWLFFLERLVAKISQLTNWILADHENAPNSAEARNLAAH